MVGSRCDWSTLVLKLLFEERGFSIGTAQGVLGSFLIKLNIAAAVYRRNSILHEWPVLEVTGAAAVTAAVSYLVSYAMCRLRALGNLYLVGCIPKVTVSVLRIWVCLHE